MIIATRLRIGLPALAAGLLLAPALAWPTTEDFRIPNPDAQNGSRFGQGVAISLYTMVVGAYLDDDAGNDAGAATVLRFDGTSWIAQQKLTPSQPSYAQRYGFSVATHGDVVIVGAFRDPAAGTESGVAYAYRFDGSTWVEEQILTPSDHAAGQRFGLAVAVQGDVAVVGAPGDSAAAPLSGAAYVFRYSGGSWVEEAKLVAASAQGGEQFGQAVSIDGDAVLVGAPSDDAEGVDSGSAFVHRFGGGGSWPLEQRLAPDDPAADRLYGASVSIDGDTALVGAPRDAQLGTLAGTAYVHRYLAGSGWVQEDELVPSSGGPYSRFGISVSIDGGMALVGTRRVSGETSLPGSVFWFRFDGGNGWPEAAELVTSTGLLDDEFGVSVALSYPNGVVGAKRDRGSGVWFGSVYVYQGTVPPLGSCSVADLDGDGFLNVVDSCPTAPNPTEQGLGPGVRGAACGQPADTDADFIPDVDDNCPFVPNTAQEDRVQVLDEWVPLGDACCLPRVSAVGQYCIAGLSTGAGFSWAIDDDGTPGVQLSDTHDLDASPGLPGASPTAIAQSFADSITAAGPYTAKATANCFDDGSGGGHLYVGAANLLPDCRVWGPQGCSFNPTITRISLAAAVSGLGTHSIWWLALVLVASFALLTARRRRVGASD